MEERRPAKVVNSQDQKPTQVIIIDDGEGFKKEKGSIPNHDKVLIEYSTEK